MMYCFLPNFNLNPFWENKNNAMADFSIDVKKIKPFSCFCQNTCVKNSMIEGYYSIINSWSFVIILSLNAGVIPFIQNSYFVTTWVTYSVSYMNYLGVPGCRFRSITVLYYDQMYYNIEPVFEFNREKSFVRWSNDE